jgi:glycosyltransferase involved in cell wall biosynthesis
MSVYRPDYVVHGSTGFLADTDEALGAGLGALLRDETQRLAMSTAAITHARQFDWDVSAAKWASVFERATHEKRG